MAGWRDLIVKEFPPQAARLTLVADPDALLLEQGVLEDIRARGYELLVLEDPVAFRFAYESTYRVRWEHGAPLDLVIVVRDPAHDLQSLPYDLLRAGRQVAFCLADIFPHLSSPVVAVLDRSDLDALYHAQSQHRPPPLGEMATKDFVLRYVFEFAPELIQNDADLLRFLLRRHYRQQRIPPVLDKRLVQLLRRDGRFAGWPLEQIVPDREAFLAFLQERWPPFIFQLAADAGQAIDPGPEAAQHLSYPGPATLPFAHQDVKVYVDSLFLDGLLRPLPWADPGVLAQQWVAVGLRFDAETDRLRRLDGLSESLLAEMPAPAARHGEWLQYAPRWAEWTVLWHAVAPSARAEREEHAQALWGSVDAAFVSWVRQHYAGLHNQPPRPPIMLHHLPRTLALHRVQTGNKVALVVLDGLALDQWVVLREALQEQQSGLRFRESAVFAWLPTTTAVSRQATFAGKIPLFYPDSLQSTDKEAGLWEQFWVNEGLVPVEIAYARTTGDEENLVVVEEALAHPKVKVVGLVVGKVDKIMHGMALGTGGMHNQVRQWALSGALTRLLDLLLDHGWAVFLTSDHGNIEAVGLGRPAEGATADLRGERVRVYPDAVLRAQVQQRFPEALVWPTIGLPKDFLALFAPNRRAFVPEGERTVAHGGISLEELIVPFVQIDRRSS
ncbi:MAG: BREX-3 system phosphatase PglZ [Anaerolineae bacterium]|nr:BREX-3 system phosphatase PglZ [Anaerolineae bacterium]